MTHAANRVGFLSQQDYITQQSGAQNRANDCGALNPESQEN